MAIKISELTPKGANLEATDLLEISEVTADGYDSKSITGAEIITAAQEGLQVALVSGTNIKTINSTSLLGSGDVDVQPTLVSGTNIKTINGNSLLGSGDLVVGGGLTIGTTAITSGTVGRVLFEGTGNVLQESANLFWDNTNSRLSVGTSTQAYTLAVGGKLRVSAYSYWVDSGANALQVDGSSSFSDNITLLGTRAILFGTSATQIGGGASGPLTLRAGSGSTQMSLFSTGNLAINTTTDAGYRLDVNGTARVVNNIFSGNGTYFTTGSQSIASASTANAFIEISSGASNSAALVFSKAGSLSTLWQLYADSSSNIAFFRNGVNKEIFKIFESTKNIGIDEVSGTSTFLDVSSAKLFVNSTTKGFLPPRMTTTQRNAITSPASGLIVYDTTDNKHYGYNGTAWTAFY